jgi:peptide deformylase
MTQKMIVKFGDPILRKTAKPVTEMSPKIEKLLGDMAETLYAADNGAGLAAPQVGILKRIIVMECGNGLIELINPEIIEMSGEQTGAEACLSYPGYVGNVSRADYVKVTYRDRTWKETIIEGHGFLARCLQHEIDHLNGVLFIDRVQGTELYHEYTKVKVNLFDVLRLSNG